MNVCVIGLGKLGAPFAGVVADSGHHVTGVDLSEEIVGLINKGTTHVKEEPGLEELIKRNFEAGRLKATTDYDEVEADVYIIVVPTLLNDDNNVRQVVIENVCENIGRILKKGDLVVLESTAPPGITDNLISPTLEKASGLKPGIDFYLAHSPERISTGTAIKDIKSSYPKVVGGINEASTQKAVEFYSTFVDRVFPVKDSRVAEMVKIAEGLYRDVNIALANELALLCQNLGVDVWDVIRGANSQTFSCFLHTPGIGVGGHCIPVYPWFAIKAGERVGFDSRLLRLSREINDDMAAHAVDQLKKKMEKNGKAMKGSSVLVLGLVYRNGVKELYHSPSKRIIKSLLQNGAKVYGYDNMLSGEEIKKFLGISPRGDKKDFDGIIYAHGEKFYNMDVKSDAVITPMDLFK